MSASATALLASGIVAKKAIENVVTDLYELAKSEGGFQLRRWTASHQIDSVYKKARAIRLVKTILQPEKEVDLSSFYYPSKVQVDNKQRVTISRLSDFGYDGNILIEGTVGQGKSIFLRYLASVELFNSRRVPAFIELRRLRQGQSLLSSVLDELKALGFDMDEKLFGVFATKGRIILCLDAFDEVKEELRQDLLLEIELLSRKFEELRIVVTSRPNLGISTSPLFRVFHLSPLQEKEYEEVLTRLAHDELTAQAIIKGIRKDAAQVAKLLTAPLMVALLLIRYRIDQSLPHNDASFYEALFSILLQRHDKSKGGYVRPRKSKLSDTNLEQTFNALCYVTSKAGETSFPHAQLSKHCMAALKVAGHTADVDSVISDIIDITCLIITDGDECRFIHKSVQEYHAAVFVRDQPEDSGIAFYKAMETRWRIWYQALRFLSVIDRYRFLKHFHIPQLRRLLEITGPVPNHHGPTRQKILECCGGDQLAFRGPKAGVKRFTGFSTGQHWPTSHLMHDDTTYAYKFFDIDRNEVRSTPLNKDGDAEVITVAELLEIQACKAKVEEACKKLFTLLLNDLREAEEFVSHVEQRKAVFEF
jgi:hypothetical protein